MPTYWIYEKKFRQPFYVNENGYSEIADHTDLKGTLTESRYRMLLVISIPKYTPVFALVK